MKGQLRSHKMFATSCEKYMSMVDAAKIFSTSAWNGPAEVMIIYKRSAFFLRHTFNLIRSLKVYPVFHQSSDYRCSIFGACIKCSSFMVLLLCLVQLIAVKDGPGKKLLIDVDTYPGARCLEDLNTDSSSVTELYSKPTDSKLVNLFWQNVILDPKRKSRQERLRIAILANASTSVLLEKTPSQLSEDDVKAAQK